MTRVLVVDDSSTMLMSLRGVLSSGGFDVRTASSGAEALESLDTEARPDLVITDLNMPQMDGLTLLGRLRTHKATRFTPVLLLTTESETSKRQEARKLGATGWLVKPVPPADLLATIGKVLGKR